jgi:hypothetical protein
VSPSREGAPSGASSYPRTRPWRNPAILAWVAARRSDGLNSKQIVAASKAGTHGWPGGRPLSDGTAVTVFAVLDVRPGLAPLSTPKRKGPSVGGKRRRKIYEEIRESGETRLRRLRIDIADAVMKLEHMVLPEDIGMTDEEQENITALYDDLMILSQWTERALTATSASMDDLHKRGTITKLRALAQNPGATPDERAQASRFAASLEARRLELARKTA